MKAKIIIPLILISLSLFSCSKLKEEIIAPPTTLKLTYKDDIKAILDQHCVSCHNPTSTTFDLSTYFGIIQSGIAIPGDPNSKIITVTQPNGSMREYLGTDASLKADKIKKWVVEDSLALGAIKIHPSDWAQVGSENSHAKFIRKTSWNLDQCKQCHGRNYNGGISKSPCYVCHNAPGGPEACNTCHGNLLNSAPPRDLNNNFSTSSPGVGAHQVHVVGGNFSLGFDCNECHIKPDSLRSPGHLPIDVNDTTLSRAEVEFQPSSLSRNSTPSGTGDSLVPNPNYSYDQLTCSNTYCHGYFKNGNLNNTPKWNVVDGTQSACGTCHGLPPGGSHPSVSYTSCASFCHNDVVELFEGRLRIKDRTKHVNGKLSLFGTEKDFSVRQKDKIVGLKLK